MNNNFNYNEMQHNHIEVSGANPFLAPFLSILFLVYANVVAPGVQEDLQWDVPPQVMHISQLIAWWCTGGAFARAVLNYFGIKWNPFKKRKK